MAKKSKRSTLEEAASLLPDTIGLIGDYLKTSKDVFLKHLSNESTTGTVSLVIKLFSKPLIEKYFVRKNSTKLENFGLNTYMEASLVQASDSLLKSIDDLEETYSIDGILFMLHAILKDKIESYTTKEWILFFQPQSSRYYRSCFIHRNFLEKYQD